jgi:hypothetical protein
MLNKYLQPEDAPVTKKRAEIGFDFDVNSDRGMVRSVQLKGGVVNEDQIADSAITTNKIAVTAITSGRIANNAVTNAKIEGFDWSKGTSGTISNAPISGGTITALIGTSLMQGGTVANAIVGTSTITGGTVNASVYKTGGTAGFSGDIGYLTAGTVQGTLTFNNGLLIGTT